MSEILEESFGIIPIKRCSGSLGDPLTIDNVRVLLILQKTFSPDHPNFWCCPKGHAEADDADPVYTAIRELEEETSLDIGPENLILANGTLCEYQESYVNPVRNTKKTVTYFAAIVPTWDGHDDRVVLQEEEVVSAAWLTFHEAVERASFKNTKNLLRRVMIDVLRVSAETLDLEIEDESYGIIPMSILPGEKGRILSSNSRVLLIHQKTFDNSGGEKLYWSLPKGHAEVGDDSPIATATRELTEETGLKSSFVWETPSFSITYWTPFKQCWKKVTYWFGLVHEQQEIKCEDREVNDARFVSWEQALELASSGNVIQTLLKKIIKFLDDEQGEGVSCW